MSVSLRKRNVANEKMVPKISDYSQPSAERNELSSPRHPLEKEDCLFNGDVGSDTGIGISYNADRDNHSLQPISVSNISAVEEHLLSFNTHEGKSDDKGRCFEVQANDIEEETLTEDTDRSLLLPSSEVRRPLFASLTPESENSGAGLIVKEESSISIAFQVFLPFLVAGLGTVGAGLLLDVVQHWEVFKEVTEVFILVPALLGLKGNLEMTLASRLSTAANIGNMDCKKKQASLITGNMILVQAQALVVAALASVAAVVFGWVLDGNFNIYHAWLLCASSLMTASLASAILGGIMVGVILLSKKTGINPDNVATPIAASLGDLTTLALLAGISSFLYSVIGSHHWIAPLLCLLCVILLPLWLYIAHHNQFTHNVLYTGWSPVIMAMCISSGGGLILSYIVAKYHGIAVFNPVINGVGGNLVAVQASRLSTHLHRVTQLGILPPGVKYGCLYSFCTSGGHARTARVLLFMSLPGHVIFLCIISWLKAGHTSVTAVFTASYLLVGFVQVFLLLFTANWMVHWMWKKKKDPDNFSIPYLTALGDLLGTFLLAVAFHLLWLIGDRDADVGD